MTISKITPLLSLALLLPTSTAANSDPELYHICLSLHGDSISTSLSHSKLLHALSSKALPTAFATAFVELSYGLALCRGDVSPSKCKSCLSDATASLLHLCTGNAAAIVWYDYCLLKCSDADFFGHIDYDNKFYLYNVMNVSNHPRLLTEKVRKLLMGLAKEAAGSDTLYAATEEELDTFTMLYGLVQCTRDLTPADCEKCLEEAVSELGKCCDGKRGGRVVGGSCNFRYEIYPFVKS